MWRCVFSANRSSERGRKEEGKGRRDGAQEAAKRAEKVREVRKRPAPPVKQRDAGTPEITPMQSRMQRERIFRSRFFVPSKQEATSQQMLDAAHGETARAARTVQGRHTDDIETETTDVMIADAPRRR